MSNTEDSRPWRCDIHNGGERFAIYMFCETGGQLVILGALIFALMFCKLADLRFHPGCDL